MIRKTRLFTPGPTPLLPAAQFAMAAADIHHRTPEFRALFQKVLAQLKVFVGTKNDVLLLVLLRHRRHGSLGLQPHLAGRRHARPHRRQVRRALDRPAQGLRLRRPKSSPRPTAQTFDLAEVRAALRPGIRAIFIQATETSTCVRHDVEAIAKLRDKSRPEALLVVDGITGLGTTHFDVDGWGIDILIGGSQKAVMIPPGLAYLSVSERAWAAMETSKNPRYYFDLRKERKNAAKGESAYTPAVALIAGLGAALDYIAGQAGGDLEKGRIALVNNAR